MSKKRHLAVLLATFNGEVYIKQQLESIKSQCKVGVHIFVSDDFSTDATLELLEKGFDSDNSLTILPSQKFGSACANFFRLIRETDLEKFDYIALADQDDIWYQDKLCEALQKIKSNNVDAYSSNVTAFWPNGKQRLIHKAQPQQQFDYMFESAGPGCTFVLNQKLAMELQKFLIANQEKCQKVALHDWFIYAFARSRGFKWFIDTESHMLYRQHGHNVVGANVGFSAKLARWKKLREGWLINQALLMARILGYCDAWPMKKLGRYNLLDRFLLILNIKKFRRRFRDRIALGLFLLLPLKK